MTKYDEIIKIYNFKFWVINAIFFYKIYVLLLFLLILNLTTTSVRTNLIDKEVSLNKKLSLNFFFLSDHNSLKFIGP